MTTSEITALRKELDGALLQAFTDFKRITGVSVIGVEVDTIGHWSTDYPNPTYHMIGVRVVLESL